MAVKPKSTGRMNSYDARLAKMAEEAVAAENARVQGGNFLSIKDGKLTFKGHQMPGGKMRCVILADCLANTYYAGAYDAKKPQSPVCYAFGQDEKEMAPHDNCSDPQHAQCKGCPYNEFGSADTGKGKACKNTRRLALLSMDTIEEGPAAIESEEVAYLSVPPTSIKAFGGYQKAVAETLKVPLCVIVTEISVVDKAIEFRNIEKIADGKIIGALLDRHDIEQAEDKIGFPFPDLTEEEPAKPAKAAAKKPAAKKYGR